MPNSISICIVVPISVVATSLPFAQLSAQEESNSATEERAQEVGILTQLDREIEKATVGHRDTMLMHLEHLKATCVLNAAQEKKLSVAIKGLVQRVGERQRCEMRELLGSDQTYDGDPEEGICHVLSLGLPPQTDEFWKKSLEMTLTPEQLGKYHAAEVVREKRQSESKACFLVNALDRELLLSTDQTKSVRKAIHENLGLLTREDRLNQNKFGQAAELLRILNCKDEWDEEMLPPMPDEIKNLDRSLKSILTELQFKNWQRKQLLQLRISSMRPAVGSASGIP